MHVCTEIATATAIAAAAVVVVVVVVVVVENKSSSEGHSNWTQPCFGAQTTWGWCVVVFEVLRVNYDRRDYFKFWLTSSIWKRKAKAWPEGRLYLEIRIARACS